MLGDKLVALRKKNGHSQQELADRLQVTRQTISNWELGQGAPSLDEEWIMLEVEAKKKKVLKMFRIDNISSIKEIL